VSKDVITRRLRPTELSLNLPNRTLDEEKQEPQNARLAKATGAKIIKKQPVNKTFLRFNTIKENLFKNAKIKPSKHNFSRMDTLNQSVAESLFSNPSKIDSPQPKVSLRRESNISVAVNDFSVP
jgi:hypothetical protein